MKMRNELHLFRQQKSVRGIGLARFYKWLFGLLALFCLFSMVSPLYEANATYAGGSMTFTSEEIDSIGYGTQVVICTVSKHSLIIQYYGHRDEFLVAIYYLSQLTGQYGAYYL